MLMYLLLPLIHELMRFNQMMSYPEALNGVEEWMRTAEDKAEELTNAFLKTDTLSGLLGNLLIVAVLASVAEELMFRSVLIRLFRSWTGNMHVAVALSAIIFSAFHLQFLLSCRGFARPDLRIPVCLVGHHMAARSRPFHQ